MDRRGEATSAKHGPGTGLRWLFCDLSGAVPRTLRQRQQHPLHETERNGQKVTERVNAVTSCQRQLLFCGHLPDCVVLNPFSKLNKVGGEENSKRRNNTVAL